MSLLTPDIGLLFWMIVSFGIVFFVLAKWGFPVITRMVDERRDYITQSLAKADEATRTLDGIRQKCDDIMAETVKNQQSILKQATDEASRIVRKAQDDAAEEGKRKLEETLRLIDFQKQKAIGDLRAQVAQLSVDIAEKILRRELDTQPAHDKLITQLLDEVESDILKN
ncbi:MAG: F0F1 ATP synthase subunit B [Tannerella sp.]|jgi:F-type H+-transporting ATPase subunit b|nr:F0F1 ATP synthase subunit B [Tannerella sp.]